MFDNFLIVLAKFELNEFLDLETKAGNFICWDRWVERTAVGLDVD
jgi:hypothetical protein